METKNTQIIKWCSRHGLYFWPDPEELDGDVTRNGCGDLSVVLMVSTSGIDPEGNDVISHEREP